MPSLLAKTAKNLLCLAVGSLLVGCATPNSERSYYEPPSSGGASVQPAIIEGTVAQLRTRGGLPSVLYEPETIDRLCAYVFSVDGQMVGDRADCTTAVPISPGKHTITAWLQGDQYFPAERSPTDNRRMLTFRPSKATLMFDAEEGHHYKISLDRIDFTRGSARIWITNVTTQTSVTEAMLVTAPVSSAVGPLGPL